jgi:hypothetical protein
MGRNAQTKAIESYRARLTEHGIRRFEVQALEADRELIRALARKLTGGGAAARQLRRTVERAMSGSPPRNGGILAALRRSPLVGANLTLERAHEQGRKVDL